jgi:hypothetical protein
MALYEIVLRFPDRDEVRLTDRALDVGDTLSIGGQTWRVFGTEVPRSAVAAARYVCDSGGEIRGSLRTSRR